MKIIEAAKAIRPVENWRYWYRKWSVWLMACVPLITGLREALPALQDLIPGPEYKLLMGVLGFVAIIASQIKQQSIAVPPNPPDPDDKP